MRKPTYEEQNRFFRNFFITLKKILGYCMYSMFPIGIIIWIYLDWIGFTVLFGTMAFVYTTIYWILVIPYSLIVEYFVSENNKKDFIEKRGGVLLLPTMALAIFPAFYIIEQLEKFLRA